MNECSLSLKVGELIKYWDKVFHNFIAFGKKEIGISIYSAG